MDILTSTSGARDAIELSTKMNGKLKNDSAFGPVMQRPSTESTRAVTHILKVCLIGFFSPETVEPWKLLKTLGRW
jgi:hypothetical protein